VVQKLFVEKNHIPRGLSLEVLTKSFDWSQKLFIKIVIKTFIKLPILKITHFVSIYWNKMCYNIKTAHAFKLVSAHSNLINMCHIYQNDPTRFIFF